jgi:hypothetical protein
VADLATSRGSIGRAGASNTSGLAAGGDLPGSPGRSALTEEFTAADFLIKTVTTS